MITSRRLFLTGLGAALVTAPAIVRATSLMPVKVILPEPIMRWLPDDNRLVRGIVFQSWPFGEPKPYFHQHGRIVRTGSITSPGKADGKPLQFFLDQLSLHKDQMYYQVIEVGKGEGMQ